MMTDIKAAEHKSKIDRIINAAHQAEMYVDCIPGFADYVGKSGTVIYKSESINSFCSTFIIKSVNVHLESNHLGKGHDVIIIKVDLRERLVEKRIRCDSSMCDLYLNQIVLIYDEIEESVTEVIRSSTNMFFDCSVSFPSIICELIIMSNRPLGVPSKRDLFLVIILSGIFGAAVTLIVELRTKREPILLTKVATISILCSLSSVTSYLQGHNDLIDRIKKSNNIEGSDSE